MPYLSVGFFDTNSIAPQEVYKWYSPWVNQWVFLYVLIVFYYKCVLYTSGIYVNY